MLLPISMFSSSSSSGPHGGVGQRNADHWPTCIEPSLAEPDYVLFGWTPLRPVAKSNCLCSCVAFSVLFRRAVNCIYRSSVDVVARGRPAPGRRLTFHVSWNRFHSLATTLLATPTASATRCVCTDSSLPITHHAMGIPVNRVVETFSSNLVSKKIPRNRISQLRQ
ncbi:hypothetical protein TNCV_3279571 [Trichonephila clavipes]|nr:hypothetical protein TNCV_3279571 [Trichonephila clavipes]